MNLKKLNMLTKWEDEKLKCACSPSTPCSKYRKGICQIEQLLYDPTQSINSCIKHRSYKRINGALKQR